MLPNVTDLICAGNPLYSLQAVKVKQCWYWAVRCPHEHQYPRTFDCSSSFWP